MMGDTVLVAALPTLTDITAARLTIASFEGMPGVTTTVTESSHNAPSPFTVMSSWYVPARGARRNTVSKVATPFTVGSRDCVPLASVKVGLVPKPLLGLNLARYGPCPSGLSADQCSEFPFESLMWTSKAGTTATAALIMAMTFDAGRFTSMRDASPATAYSTLTAEKIWPSWAYSRYAGGSVGNEFSGW
jgi:hypothetical protein